MFHRPFRWNIWLLGLHSIGRPCMSETPGCRVTLPLCKVPGARPAVGAGRRSGTAGVVLWQPAVLRSAAAILPKGIGHARAGPWVAGGSRETVSLDAASAGARPTEGMMAESVCSEAEAWTAPQWAGGQGNWVNWRPIHPAARPVGSPLGCPRTSPGGGRAGTGRGAQDRGRWRGRVWEGGPPERLCSDQGGGVFCMF